MKFKTKFKQLKQSDACSILNLHFCPFLHDDIGKYSFAHIHFTDYWNNDKTNSVDILKYDCNMEFHVTVKQMNYYS